MRPLSVIRQTGVVLADLPPLSNRQTTPDTATWAAEEYPISVIQLIRVIRGSDNRAIRQTAPEDIGMAIESVPKNRRGHYLICVI